ncbi:MAG: hypothetical protein K9M10_02560 [Candidatus Pacebacteria bacterium]|nr:hypothetical protein [Candidatus Paceibacterota bacterium]MCF7857338.1 hypothetical protein [Candidatus Paceibacterota bacterium]
MDIGLHWQELQITTAFLIFVVYIIIDGMYAHYTLAVAGKRPFQAATTGALMHFLLAFGVLNYVQNYLYIVPLAMGSWVGTYIVVRKSTLSAHE